MLSREFRVFDLLDAFVADFGQPAFERLGLGAGDGLDEPKDALGVPALEFLAPARGIELESMGGDKLTPLEEQPPAWGRVE